MKIAALIARILLGLVFVVFGLNKLYPFMPQQPLPPGTAGQFMSAMFTSHYLTAVGAFEVAGGFLLLINRYVPLGLCLLAPVIVNILLTGVLLTHMALGSGIVVAILWIVVYWRHRAAFAGLFQAKTSA
jgi:putative oxidoreductase